MNISELCREAEAYIIEQRRWFHQHPEVSLKETGTSRKVQDELQTMGIPFKVLADQIGVVATIQGAFDGKRIGIRADMDALPVVEETGLAFRSENPGIAHDCTGSVKG